jgi:hypothetical protein
VTDFPSPFPADRPDPVRRKRRRRRRRRQPPASAVAQTLVGGLIPPVIKVEIQNIDQLGRSDAASREGDERLEARLAALEQGLAERARRVEELEDRIGPEAALVESRESLERRELRAGELETRLREQARELDERENDLEARRVVVEADLELREEEVERREDLLGIREERLAERQRELGLYVSQIQGRIESQHAAG